MAADYPSELARLWVAEQGAEAAEHLADAIRELHAVGDRKGERLLRQIAQQVDLVEDLPPHRHPRREMIRRPREGGFDPSA